VREVQWLVLGAMLAGLGTSAVAATAQSHELPTTIVTLGGRADVSRNPGAWAPAALRDELSGGDAVRTVAGRLTLRTGSGEVMRLGPRSLVALVTPGTGATGGPTWARLDAGRVWISVLPGSPRAARIALRAGPVTVTAQNGGAGVAVNPDGSALVSVYHGAVTCAGDGWQRVLTQDQELLVLLGAAPPKNVARLKRDKRDQEWIAWNEQQDQAGGYGARVDK